MSSSPMAPIKAVVFDMGDILFDATPWRRKVAAHLASRGVDIDYKRLVPLWEHALVPVYTGKRPYWDAFRDFVGARGLDAAEVELAESEARRFASEVKERVLFDGVADTLAKLHESGLRLAVLSDTESTESVVRRRLEKLGVSPYFEAAVTSFDLGYVKPMPEAFQAALDRIGCSKDEAAFVAHDVDELEGAMAFGLYTVAYNYEPGAPANRHLEHFSELVEAVLPATG